MIASGEFINYKIDCFLDSLEALNNPTGSDVEKLVQDFFVDIGREDVAIALKGILV